MLFRLFCLVAGFICGYLLIGWVPIKVPLVLSEYIVEYLFNPLKFFVIMICFFIGFLANSILIKTVIEDIILLFMKQKINIVQTLISCSVIGSFYLLFKIGFWQSFVLLCFAAIYGIISIDINRKKVYEQKR